LTHGKRLDFAEVHLWRPSTRWKSIINANAIHREPWNKGKIVGKKAPFKLKDIWALRVRRQLESRVRELALFNLGIDSKLRGCDLVSLKVRDICHGDQVATRAVVMQHKTQRPVQFEITPATREALQKWIKQARLRSEDFKLLPGTVAYSHCRPMSGRSRKSAMAPLVRANDRAEPTHSGTGMFHHWIVLLL
jgi:integrase